MEERERCDVCHEILSAEATALGWPIATLDGAYVCPSCYGDEAFCPEGHVLAAESDSACCAACMAR